MVNVYRCWREDGDRDDGIDVEAHDAEDAAEKMVEEFCRTSAEYMDDDETMDVCVEGTWYTVAARHSISYSARLTE